MTKFLFSLYFVLSYVAILSAYDYQGASDTASIIDSSEVRLVISEAQEKYADNQLAVALKLLRTVSPSISFNSLKQKATYNNLKGSCYLRLGKLDSAQYYLENTTEVVTSDDYPTEYAYATSFLAMIAEDQGS